MTTSSQTGRGPSTAEQELSPLERTVVESDSAISNRIQSPVLRAGAIGRAAAASKPARVARHYLSGEGNLLAAGMSFQSVFAVFAAVFVGFSIFGLFLSRNSDVFDSLVDIVNSAVPGLLGDEGAIKTDSLLQQNMISWTGIIALAGLLWTAIGWMYSTRQAIRTVFRLPRDNRPFVRQKVADLLLAAGFGGVMLVSAVVSVVSTQIWEWLLGTTGVGTTSVWATIGSRALAVVISAALNFVVLSTMYRVLAHIPIPKRLLFEGAAVASAGIAILGLFAGIIISGASKNPLLATFAVFAGLLVWFNMVSRVILLGASWIAVSVADRGLADRMLSDEDRRAELARATLVVARERLREAEENEAGTRFWGRRRARRLTETRRDELAAAEREAEANSTGPSASLGT
ncbi:YihY/virulence factor BrkB family protein [Mycetocola reblochoni]|uniref:Putative integral membrane protein n=1 Tax=Mycetocola reblochoni REB411 TaxID=1255698 RepID=A0A1R4JIJ7_9MICO|nr:YihY/virulence factor BrkB family protein [Mycetocola reblochoni]SJN31839.1 putative integral membrane protein [Mycetocola reblochoni REB411]